MWFLLQHLLVTEDFRLLVPDPFKKLEVFIEHIPRAVMNVYRPGCMQCMQLYIQSTFADALCTSNRAAIYFILFILFYEKPPCRVANDVTGIA